MYMSMRCFIFIYGEKMCNLLVVAIGTQET